MDERTHPMTYKNEDELKKALEIDTWKGCIFLRGVLFPGVSVMRRG